MSAEQPIPFLRAEFPAEIVDKIMAVLTSGYVGAGPVVDDFELAIQEYLSAPNVVCTSSCTAALSLVYEELGATRGTRVLSTAMTCAATNLPLLHAGSEIIWLDVDPHSGNVTPQTLATALAEQPEVHLAAIVDWAGMPCDYEGLRKVAQSHGIPVVLDAAQSFGSTVDGSRLPSLGDYICYSFGPTKILSGVEGGAIVTRHHGSARKLRSARWYGVDRAARDPVAFWQYDILEPGHRYTTNDVFATVGLHMLKRFEARLETHRRVAAIYMSRLADVVGLTLPVIGSSIAPNFWMFTITVDRRADFIRKLHARDIHAATPHNRNDHLSCFAGRPSRDLPGLTHFAEHYVCLPVGPWVSEEDAERVCEVIRTGW